MSAGKHKWNVAHTACLQCGLEMRFVDRPGDVRRLRPLVSEYRIADVWVVLKKMPPCGKAPKVCTHCGGKGVVS